MFHRFLLRSEYFSSSCRLFPCCEHVVCLGSGGPSTCSGFGFSSWHNRTLTNLYTRKELTHMLHSRRKAEIEVLATMKPSPSASNRPQFFYDKRHKAEGVYTTLNCDAKVALEDLHTEPSSFDYSEPASLSDILISSSSTGLPYSSPFTSPYSSPRTAYHSTAPPHAPLVRYLVRKVTDFIARAKVHASAMETDARSL